VPGSRQPAQGTSAGVGPVTDGAAGSDLAAGCEPAIGSGSATGSRPAIGQEAAASPEAGAGSSAGPEQATSAPGLRPRLPGWLVAGLIYLVLGVAMWWHAWTGHPTSTMVCACGDPSSFAWFMEWPAFALSHGHSLLLSNWAHVPNGMNLLDNTSVLALGVTLSPVTLLFGPIAALNVALTLAPPLTALAGYGCLRRSLGLRQPAAFLGGLLFGFSPFIMRNEAFDHLQVTFLALLPLIFMCCYELAVTQRGTWWRWGLLLGLLVTVQFFVGVEMLAITALLAAFALFVAFLAALGRSGTLNRKLPFAARGFTVAAITAVVLLAYPLWFTLAGPQHIKGADWKAVTVNGLQRLLFPVQQGNLLVTGYLGPGGTRGAYIGLAALAVVAIAVFVVRRPLVSLLAVILVAAMWLSLGARNFAFSAGGQPSWLWLPWRLFDGLPLLKNITPANFSAAAVFCVAVIGAVLVDRAWPGDSGAQPSIRPGPAVALAGRLSAARMTAAAGVSAALVIPWLIAWPLPYTTTDVSAPASIAAAEARLPAAAVVLYYPFPSSYVDKALVWQAEDGMRYRIVGGRGIATLKSGAADHGFTRGTLEGTMSALTASAIPHGSLKLPGPPTASTIASFRRGLRSYGVTNVIMTTGGRAPAYARHWLTVVLGAAPQLEGGGTWEWSNVQQLLSR
jgi:hypothetical protein